MWPSAGLHKKNRIAATFCVVLDDCN